MAIDLVSRGLIDLKPLITHRYKWEEAVQAYQTTAAAKSRDGKMAIKVLSKYSSDPADQSHRAGVVAMHSGFGV